jgi:hypothetical protein
MIGARALPRLGTDLLRPLAFGAALAAAAVAAVVLWNVLQAGDRGLKGVILYTTAQGDITVRPNGEPVEVAGPPLVSFVPPGGGVEEFPAPDGSAVVYVQREAGGAWLAVRDDGGPRRLAQLADETSPPLVAGVKQDAQVAGGVPLVVSWSPDSRYVAYGSLTGAPYTLHVVERATWSQRDHAVAGGFIGELAWSPGGDRLAVSTYSPDRLDHTAYVLDPGGGTPLRLIDGCHIIWSPDGAHLALHRDPHRAPGAWVVAIDGSGAYALSDDPTAFPLSWQSEDEVPS